MSIPKIIHQFWISPSGNEIPDDIKANIQSWHVTHPDFIRITWTLPRLSKSLENFHGLNVLECVKACQFPAMQSDLIRLAMVYEHGGFWSDLKNCSLHSFLYDFLEHDIPVLAEHWPVKQRPNTTPHLLKSFFGAPRHNEFIWLCLEKACQNISTRQKLGIFGLTGAGVIMNMLEQAKNSGSPCEYHFLKHSRLWKTHLKREGGSYNNGNQHCSIRQKTESLFDN